MTDEVVRLETAEKYRAMYDGLVAALHGWCDERQAVDFGHEPWFVRELRTLIPESVTNDSADPRAAAWREGWAAGVDHACGLTSEDNPYGDD